MRLCSCITLENILKMPILCTFSYVPLFNARPKSNLAYRCIRGSVSTITAECYCAGTQMHKSSVEHSVKSSLGKKNPTAETLYEFLPSSYMLPSVTLQVTSLVLYMSLSKQIVKKDFSKFWKILVGTDSADPKVRAASPHGEWCWWYIYTLSFAYRSVQGEKKGDF